MRASFTEESVRPEFALLRVEGFVRSSGQGMAAHLGSAGSRLQLFERLRALPFPEKLIPLTILNALAGERLPVRKRRKRS